MVRAVFVMGLAIFSCIGLAVFDYRGYWFVNKLYPE